MNEDERLLRDYPLFMDRLLGFGWDAAEIWRDGLIAMALIGGLGVMFGSGGLVVRAAGAVSAITAIIDRLLWAIGLGSVIEWFVG